MTKVVGIKFKEAGKLYYFSPGEFKVGVGDNVIVETARGLEFGTVTTVSYTHLDVYKRQIRVHHGR